MHLLTTVALSTLLALVSTNALAAGQPHRVLFIGNSLTYVNDLPSAFASLAPAGAALKVDMVAKGGAALEDYVDDPLVSKALRTGHYTDVVLQERGGDAFCEATCQASGETLPAERAANALATLARQSGARVVYLGTWQTSRETNAALEFGERRIARAIGASYVEIAESRRALMSTHPSLAWTHADGQHPGYATTAMMALRVWRAVVGEVPRSAPCVTGTVHYHAPDPDGVWHVDRGAKPVTCLVSVEVVKDLAGAR